MKFCLLIRTTGLISTFLCQSGQAHCYIVQIHVQIKFPEPTNHGLEFLQSENDQTFNVYPEADMLLSMEKPKSYCSFSDWGKGWADPEIRRQRLESKRSSGKQGKRQKSKKRKSRKSYGGFTTARSRLSAKLSKKRWWIKAIDPLIFQFTCKRRKEKRIKLVVFHEWIIERVGICLILFFGSCFNLSSIKSFKEYICQ